MIFLESVRLENGKVFNLNYHQQRVDETFEKIMKDRKSFCLYEEIQKMKLPSVGLYKIRIEYGSQIIKKEIIPYNRKKIEKFYFVNGEHIFYDLKYADRTCFMNLEKNIPDAEMIILKNGMITDTSFSNLVFCADNQWVTPKNFLLNGTTRKRLLSEKKIKEMEIHYKNIFDFETIGIINSMNDLEENVFKISRDNIIIL